MEEASLHATFRHLPTRGQGSTLYFLSSLMSSCTNQTWRENDEFELKAKSKLFQPKIKKVGP